MERKFVYNGKFDKKCSNVLDFGKFLSKYAILGPFGFAK
jgi:hypothetical protein